MNDSISRYIAFMSLSFIKKLLPEDIRQKSLKETVEESLTSKDLGQRVGFLQVISYFVGTFAIITSIAISVILGLLELFLPNFLPTSIWKILFSITLGFAFLSFYFIARFYPAFLADRSKDISKKVIKSSYMFYNIEYYIAYPIGVILSYAFLSLIHF